jgi:ParB/RepB/Spo0J family partition protein
MTEAVVQIPITDLYESPFNPRRRFNDVSLQELATDIAEQGVQSPIVVRCRMIDATAVDPVDMFDGYELVFGHRRLRAAQIAALTTMPCIVRAMTDSQVKRAQISENLQREDVHPIEEAEGFQALLDDESTLTPEKLGEQFGKSRTYVYSRIKLLQACAEIREACLKGEIGAEVTLLIARLRTDKLQQKALGYIRGKYLDMKDGGQKSFRSIRDLLNERFTLDLKKAIFDTKDETLLPACGTCVACPRRSGNAPEYSDVQQGKRERHWSSTHFGADVCTDPDCWDEKKKAHLKRKADALTAKGKTVIDGNKARQIIGADGQVKNGYVEIKNVGGLVDPKVAKARLAAQKNSSIVPPLVVTIQNPRDGKTIEAVKITDLQAAGVKIAEKPARGTSGNYQQQEKARQAEEARRTALAKEESARRLRVLKAIRESIKTSDRSTFDLQLIAMTALAGVPYGARRLLASLWGRRDEADMPNAIGSMEAGDLTVFLFDCALISECVVDTYRLDKDPERLLSVAKHYGVDVAAASTPPSAARGGGEAAAKAKTKGKPAGATKAARATSAAQAQEDQSDDAGTAGEEQTDEAGCAGEEVMDEPADAGDRDPDTADMFGKAEA